MIDSNYVANLHTLIFRSNNLWGRAPLFSKEANLVGIMASQLAQALDGAEVEFVTAMVPEKGADYTYVMAFSGRRIAITSWRPARDESPSGTETLVFNTDAINELEIVRTPDYMTNEWQGEKRTTVRVKVGKENFPLPADASASEICRNQLTAFLPTLLELYAPSKIAM